jgi:hypothetical protein
MVEAGLPPGRVSEIVGSLEPDVVVGLPWMVGCVPEGVAFVPLDKLWIVESLKRDFVRETLGSGKIDEVKI